jgi:hypothetical protein
LRFSTIIVYGIYACRRTLGCTFYLDLVILHIHEVVRTWDVPALSKYYTASMYYESLTCRQHLFCTLSR